MARVVFDLAKPPILRELRLGLGLGQVSSRANKSEAQVHSTGVHAIECARSTLDSELVARNARARYHRRPSGRAVIMVAAQSGPVVRTCAKIAVVLR